MESVGIPLMIRFGAMGDMVMLIPALQHLHSRCNGNVVLVCKGKWNVDIFRRFPYIQVVPVARTQVPSFLWGARKRWPEFVPFDFHNSPVFVGQERSRYVTSLVRWLGIRDAQTCWFDDIERLPREHDSHRFLRLAAMQPNFCPHWQMQPLVTPVISQLPVMHDELEAARDWLEKQGLQQRKVVLVQVGNKKTMKSFGSYRRRSNTKHWPIHYWQQTLDALSEADTSAFFVLTGTAQEFQLLEEVRTACRSRSVLNAAGHLPLRLLIGLLHESHSMISVDTGPAHLAGAIGCPLTVLFTASNSYAFCPTSPNSQYLQILRHENGWDNAPNPTELIPEIVIETHRKLLVQETGACRMSQ